MKIRCRTARQRIMEFLDENPGGTEIDPVVADHLNKCRRCERLLETSRLFTRDLTAVADEADRRLGMPDLSFLEHRNTEIPGGEAIRTDRRWTNSNLLRVAAAATVIVALGLGGLFGVTGLRERKEMRSETVYFVEALFSEPLFTTADRSDSGSALYSNTDIVSDLVLPPPPGL